MANHSAEPPAANFPCALVPPPEAKKSDYPGWTAKIRVTNCIRRQAMVTGA